MFELFDNPKRQVYSFSCSAALCFESHCTLMSQLQDKFENLKRIQHEEMIKLEEEKRQLEEDIVDLYKMKATSETFQPPMCTNVKKDKGHKK